uniref:ABC transporter family protein n=1 Tax=Rhizophora mucronata TaxID=61149 RepID=A0A2P2L9M7_RHIMU
MFMLTTKITVKIGSKEYKSPTLLSSFHRGSGLAPISTSKNRPEKMGIERVQVVQPTRLKAENDSLTLCLTRRLPSSPQLINFCGGTFSLGSSPEVSILGSGSLTIGSEAGPVT